MVATCQQPVFRLFPSCFPFVFHLLPPGTTCLPLVTHLVPNIPEFSPTPIPIASHLPVVFFAESLTAMVSVSCKVSSWTFWREIWGSSKGQLRTNPRHRCNSWKLMSGATARQKNQRTPQTHALKQIHLLLKLVGGGSRENHLCTWLFSLAECRTSGSKVKRDKTNQNTSVTSSIVFFHSFVPHLLDEITFANANKLLMQTTTFLGRHVMWLFQGRWSRLEFCGPELSPFDTTNQVCTVPQFVNHTHIGVASWFEHLFHTAGRSSFWESAQLPHPWMISVSFRHPSGQLSGATKNQVWRSVFSTFMHICVMIKINCLLQNFRQKKSKQWSFMSSAFLSPRTYKLHVPAAFCQSINRRCQNRSALGPRMLNCEANRFSSSKRAIGTYSIVRVILAQGSLHNMVCTCKRLTWVWNAFVRTPPSDSKPLPVWLRLNFHSCISLGPIWSGKWKH